MESNRVPLRVFVWLVACCIAVFALTSPGRLAFPDEEIVFQTTESLAERGSFRIAGISKRTGERRDRPSGTFGWAEGRKGGRYGFFGHGLSLVALPAFALADLTAGVVPETWHHARVVDGPALHQRSAEADWLRMVVGFTNVFVAALAALVFGLWVQLLGYKPRTAVVCAGALAFGTSLFPYSGTFLSEPLGMLVLLVATYAISRWHAERESPWLWVAGVAAGFSVHVHVLDVLALPLLAAFAAYPSWRDGRLREDAQVLVPAFALALVGVLLLGLSQWLRFGSPFETGRMGHYGHFVWPFEGLVAQLIAPGRSVVLYSPALLVGLFGLPALRKRLPVVTIFALAMFVVRFAFVSARSDWFGGWSLGSRYLVPVVPFLLLPIAEVVESSWNDPPKRRALVLALATCFVLELHLATHSMLTWMSRLNSQHGAGWPQASHWDPWSSPLWGFCVLESAAIDDLVAGRFSELRASISVNSLSFGAVRLAGVGHPGLLVVFMTVLASGVGAAVGLSRWLFRPNSPERNPPPPA